MLSNPGDKLAAIAAARNADGRLEAFGTATDHTIWHAWQTAPGGGWSAWHRLSKRIDLVNLAAEQTVDGRLEVFAIARTNTIWHTSQSSPGIWAADPPDEPPAPRFINVSQTSITIVKSPLPDFTSSFTLEQGQSGGSYNVLSNDLRANFTLSGLQPNTRYTFRFVAVGPGGKAVGAPATVTTLMKSTDPMTATSSVSYKTFASTASKCTGYYRWEWEPVSVKGATGTKVKVTQPPSDFTLYDVQSERLGDTTVCFMNSDGGLTSFATGSWRISLVSAVTGKVAVCTVTLKPGPIGLVFGKESQRARRHHREIAGFNIHSAPSGSPGAA